MLINSTGTGNVSTMEVKAGVGCGKLSIRAGYLDIISINLRTVDTETGKQVTTPLAFVYLSTWLLIYPLHNSSLLMAQLSPTAQKFQDLLKSFGYDFTVIEHTDSTRTAQEAADRAGCELGQIVKSMIFMGQQTGKPILVLTSGANRVDEKRISEYAGESIGRPQADFVRSVTGFAIGGVPPIGHIQKMETYIDEDFLPYKTVWAAAGTPNAIFELQTEALQKMTGGKVVRVK